MGIFNAMTGYAHKSELRESKDEIVCGELIRGLSARGWRCFRVVGDSGRQTIGFRVPGDPVVSAAYIVIDRKTGSGALTSGLGSKTVVGLATLAGVQGPFNSAQLTEHVAMHQVPPGPLAAFAPKYNDRFFAWVLQDVRPLAPPRAYQHPSGAVIWVTLPDDLLRDAV